MDEIPKDRAELVSLLSRCKFMKAGGSSIQLTSSQVESLIGVLEASGLRIVPVDPTPGMYAATMHPNATSNIRRVKAVITASPYAPPKDETP